MSKVCTKCGETKPLERFSKQGGRRDGHRSICKDCHNAYVREVWYKKNTQRQIDASNLWKKNNKAAVLAAKYKTSTEEIQTLLDYGKCQICTSTDDLHIDHCHETGRVRGILCRGCNHGLGNFKDSVDRLQAAMLYLNNT